VVTKSALKVVTVGGVLPGGAGAWLVLARSKATDNENNAVEREIIEVFMGL